MASEKWGYLLSIPSEGNHPVYIVLFMAGQELRARVCVCQTVDARPRESSEGQRKEMKVFLSLPGSLSLLLFWMSA